jgi:hypothetical protein
MTATGTPRHHAALAAVVSAALLAGCATARVEGEWAAPEFAGASLRDRTTLVSCNAPDETLRRICEDRLLAALGEAGLRAIRAPEAAGGGIAADASLLAAARNAGARAVLRTTVVSSGVVGGGGGYGPSIGIGIGGGTGGRIGVGGGITLPIGGAARAQEAFGASTSLLDTASGNPMWSVRTGSATGADPVGQIEQLARATAEAMKKAGLL